MRPCCLTCGVHVGTSRVPVCGRVTVGGRALGSGSERDHSLTEGSWRGRSSPGQPLKGRRGADAVLVPPEQDEAPGWSVEPMTLAPSLTPILELFGLLPTFHPPPEVQVTCPLNDEGLGIKMLLRSSALCAPCPAI